MTQRFTGAANVSTSLRRFRTTSSTNRRIVRIIHSTTNGLPSHFRFLALTRLKFDRHPLILLDLRLLNTLPSTRFRRIIPITGYAFRLRTIISIFGHTMPLFTLTITIRATRNTGPRPAMVNDIFTSTSLQIRQFWDSRQLIPGHGR